MIATLAPFVFYPMGTAVSVTASAPLDDALRAEIAAAFEALEERFSLYRPETDASRVARREISVLDASPAYQDVYAQAALWRTRTDDAFTPHRPDGVIDLSGIVKALAIRATAEILDAHGVHDFCINAGGDVLTAGRTASGEPWQIGIVDPADRTQLLSRVEASDAPRAVCTSGVAERGEHVWRVGRDATFNQVTVVAHDIVTADVLATAILAGGPQTMDLACDNWNIEVLACAPDGRLWATAAFRA